MLQERQSAPDFKLPRIEGGEARFYDHDQLSVLVFYKYNCPTCQLALPYIQKMYDAYGDATFFVAIAQDGPEKTSEFRSQYGITMPTLLDQNPYSVSRSFGLESVPSIFIVNPDRTIRFAGEGFVKQELLNLADVLAEQTHRPQIDVFGNEYVPEIKPG